MFCILDECLPYLDSESEQQGQDFRSSRMELYVPLWCVVAPSFACTGRRGHGGKGEVSDIFGRGRLDNSPVGFTLHKLNKGSFSGDEVHTWQLRSFRMRLSRSVRTGSRTCSVPRELSTELQPHIPEDKRSHRQSWRNLLLLRVTTTPVSLRHPMSQIQSEVAPYWWDNSHVLACSP